MADVNEYLFIDRARVDSYFEQLASTVKLVKLPAWKVAFGLAGPTVEGTQSTAIQTHGVHEKVTTLMSKLKPFRGEPAPFHGDDGDFVFETMNATRAFIPAGVSKRQDLPGVVIWLSTRAAAQGSSQGFRYLIEDFQQDDKTRTRSSGYSVVRALCHELRGKLDGTGFKAFTETEDSPTVVRVTPQAMHHLNTMYVDTFRNTHTGFANAYEAYYADKEQTLRQILALGGVHDYDDYTIKYDGVGNDYPKRGWHFFSILIGDQIHSVEINGTDDVKTGTLAEIKRDRQRELENRIVHEPARMLQELGAVVSPPRKIDCLFRIRHSGQSATGLTIIGYPIFITASPSTFKNQS